MTSTFDVTCPAGQMVNRMDLNVGSSIRGIKSITCKPPKDLNTPGGTAVPVNTGGSDWNAYSWECPAGTAVGRLRISSDGNWIRTITPFCRNLRTRAIANSYTYGNEGKEAQYVTDSINAGCDYIVGISGTSGSSVKEIKWKCGNFDQARRGLFTDDGKANCCMGKFLSGNCPDGFTPQSYTCDRFMTSWCQTHPNDSRCSCVMSEMTCPNKFDKNCMNNNGYRTTDMVKTPCPSIMNCTQFLGLSPGAQNIASNVEQNCTSKISGSGAAPGTAGTTDITNTAPAFTSGTFDYTFIIWMVLLFVLILTAAWAYTTYFADPNKKEKV